MEYKEALQQLRERLDDCLIRHAKSIQRDDIGDLYKLQAYSETHYYMKAAHDYTPAEVEALLQFVDPLEVAYWCREENTHQVGLPVCDILKEIHADERFEKTEPDLLSENKTVKLIERLEAGLSTFFDIIQQLDDGELSKRSERISATFAAYSYFVDELMRDNLDEGVIDHLLGVVEPLQYLTDRWPECTLFGDDVLSDLQKEVMEHHSRPEQSRSVHERLQDAKRQADSQPAVSSGDLARGTHKVR